MKKKRSLLWRLISATLYLLLFFLVAVFLFFILIFSRSNDDFVDSQTLKNSLGGEIQDLQMTRDEMIHFERKRDGLARQINPGIRVFYKQNGFYPKSLNDLPIAKIDEFVKYSRGINYVSGMKNNKPFYKLNWLSSSPWNGMQCLSGIKPKDPSGHELFGEQAKSVNDNCYVLDYH